MKCKMWKLKLDHSFARKNKIHEYWSTSMSEYNIFNFWKYYTYTFNSIIYNFIFAVFISFKGHKLLMFICYPFPHIIVNFILRFFYFFFSKKLVIFFYIFSTFISFSLLNGFHPFAHCALSVYVVLCHQLNPRTP